MIRRSKFKIGDEIKVKDLTKINHEDPPRITEGMEPDLATGAIYTIAGFTPLSGFIKIEEHSFVLNEAWVAFNNPILKIKDIR